MKHHKQQPCVGDMVEVRSKEEILQTLDAGGQLDGMPFMPEMFQFCGQQFRVYKRAHKTCDYTTGYPYRSARLPAAVHLETRCDGTAHGGCQAGCLLYWKKAWLKPVTNDAEIPRPGTGVSLGSHTKHLQGSGCSEAEVLNHTQVRDPEGGSSRYICQATQIPYATKPLAWWDVRQYFIDYSSGNVGLGRVFSALIYSIYYHLSQAGVGLGPAMRWFYDKCYPVWDGTRFPRTRGAIPNGSPTPAAALNLQPGELVRVKPHGEILKTINTLSKNRGMYWDAELVPYCGGTYRVLRRVSRVIDEQTGMMLEMKTPCIVLDKVVCQARYSPGRMLCPKSMYPYWREIWLERVTKPQ